MRDALNNNPKVQAGVVVGLLIFGALLFMKMSGGGSEAPPASTAATASATGVPQTVGTGAGATTMDSTGAAVPATATATATGTPTATGTAVPSAPTASTGAVSAEAFVPGPGMPVEVAQAYARDNALVLLIVKEGATDDDLVRDSVARISRPGVAVFVAPASRIARYSRIAQGAGVSRVPALVVVRPRSVSDVPEAIVSYGFRNSQGVVQAVDDALYKGRDDIPYHPG